MTTRRRVPYVLAAFFSAAFTAGMLYALPYRTAIAKYRYAEWYHTAASMADLVSASLPDRWIPVRKATKRVLQHVPLESWHDRARVDFDTQVSLDAWGQPIRMMPTEDEPAFKFVSFGPNQLDDREENDDIVVECTQRIGCHWSPWPAGLRFLHGAGAGVLVLFAAGVATFFAYLATHGHRVLWHVGLIVINLGSVGIIAFTPRGDELKAAFSHLGSFWAKDGKIHWWRVASGAPFPERVAFHRHREGCGGGGGKTIDYVMLGGFEVRGATLFAEVVFYTGSAPIWLATLPAAACFPLAVVAFRRDRRRRRRHATGFCLQCGYNLTGLPEPRCPECGTPFALIKT